jgi:RNA polymerase sigma-70 factor (ECF subfamily)
MDWLTTSTILHDLRDLENRAAWERFVLRFRAPVVSFARGVGVPPEQCEDVAQETLLAFVKSYQDGKYDRSKGHLSSWLFGIAYRQALMHLRRDRRREPLLPALDDSRPPGDNVPDERFATTHWDMRWEEFVFQECYARVRSELSEETRRAFERVVLDDASADQAAAELGVPVKAVYNAKHRVLKRIREVRGELEATDGPPSPRPAT